MRCSSPNCRTDRAEGSRFCERHRDQFAAVAAEIDAGKEQRLRSPEGQRKRPKLCEIRECSERAQPREAYCARHLEVLARQADATQARSA